MKPNVLERIVYNNLCIGCGICAGVCPANVLKMDFNELGEYNPVESPGCLKNCSLCLDVCPFYNQAENEDSLARDAFGNTDGIKYKQETGHYLDSYVGYSKINDHRTNGASGGMATWILESLLTKNIVDRVVCVTPNDDSEKLFRFAVFNDAESIRHSAKSAYYPVEMSNVIKEIVRNEGRYAITGLPCFLKGLILAAKKNKKIKERIIITLGLVCGQMKSKYYTTYLASLAGVNSKLRKVNYRGKSPLKPASNYFFHCVNEKNSEGKLFWDEGVCEAWVNRWFTPNACNFCDDVFAEVADVTCMDAWLQKYKKDSKGTSLVMVRTSLVRELLEAGCNENMIMLEKIPIQDVIHSQLGVLNIKRDQLAYRLYRAKKEGKSVQQKRIKSTKKLSFLNKKEVILQDRIQNLSKELFLKWYNQGYLNKSMFIKEMNKYAKKLENCRRFISYLSLPLKEIPVRIIRKLTRLLGN